MRKPQFVFVVGATGTGKSHWALEEGVSHDSSCIINCDSVQTYSQVQIGANKPSKEELKTLPHYLFSFVNPPQEMTAGIYMRTFWEQQDKLITEKNNFVVGGTGFYFLSIEKGMFDVNPVADEILQDVRTHLQTPEGAELMYQEMITRDPELQGKIFPNDHYRIERSVSLMRSEKKTITQIDLEKKSELKPFPHPLLKIGLWKERDDLRQIITQRTEKMLQSGLIEEVETLLKLGLRDWSPMKSVGYAEVVSFLEESKKLEVLKEEIINHTMQLAKRQTAWFKRDKDIFWVHDNESRLHAKYKLSRFLEARI